KIDAHSWLSVKLARLRIRLFCWLLCGGLGCGGARPQPQALSGARAPNPAAAAAPPATEVAEPKVWTTPSDSDACTEYARRFAPEHRLFDAKQQCDAWVKERRCRPGRVCSDGCNTVSCDGSGMKTISTIAECSVYLGEGVE